MKRAILPVRFGLIISGILIAYFLLLSLFDKHINPVFSFLNAIITALGIFETVRYYRLEQGDSFDYSKGFSAGLISGFVGSVAFTLFFLVYATEINDGFLERLLDSFQSGYDVSIGMVTFVVFIMGVATTVVSTLTVMQYFKKSWNVS